MFAELITRLLRRDDLTTDEASAAGFSTGLFLTSNVQR